MDWIRANKSLAAILGVAAAGVIGLAVVLYLSFSAYSDSADSLQAQASKVAGMEKAKLYPNEANLETKEEKVAAYEEEVGKLGAVLLALQKEVTSTKAITDTDFQAKLKQHIAEIRERGKDVLPKDFAFGFTRYTTSLPSQESTADVNDYFDGVDAIVTAALDAGVKKIDGFNRSELAVENGGAKPKVKKTAPAPKPAPSKGKGKNKGKDKVVKAPPPPVAQVIERRVITFDITADQAPLQTFVNALASATTMKHFTVLRMLRVENEKQEGPLNRVAPPTTGTGGYKVLNKDGLISAATVEPATPEPAPDGTTPAKPEKKEEVIVAAKPEQPDAVKVLGGEMLKAHLEIDLVRFLEPDAEAAPADAAK